MSDILKQIQALQEQFSNLFEVEGLGNPAVDVPPSQNKIKKDVKTKDGKVELVSVEDELFPYDGNKREQYRQKILDTINGMIQGTSTLEDLLQIVRQKKAPLKEAMKILEDLESTITKKYGPMFGDKATLKGQRLHSKAIEVNTNELIDAARRNLPDEEKDSTMALDREANKIEAKRANTKNKIGEFKTKLLKRAYGNEKKPEALKEALEIMEAIINEVSDKTAFSFLEKRVKNAVNKFYNDDELNKKEEDAVKALIKRKRRQGKELSADEKAKIEEAMEILEKHVFPKLAVEQGNAKYLEADKKKNEAVRLSKKAFDKLNKKIKELEGKGIDTDVDIEPHVTYGNGPKKEYQQALKTANDLHDKAREADREFTKAGNNQRKLRIEGNKGVIKREFEPVPTKKGDNFNFKKVLVKNEALEEAIEVLENLQDQIEKKFKKGEISLDKAFDLAKKIESKMSQDKNNQEREDKIQKEAWKIGPNVEKAAQQRQIGKSIRRNERKNALTFEAIEEALNILLEGRKEGESQEDFKHRIHHELVRAIDKKAEEARDKSIEASKNYHETGKGKEEAIKASEKHKKEHDKLAKLDDIEPVANAYVEVEPSKKDEDAKAAQKSVSRHFDKILYKPLKNQINITRKALATEKFKNESLEEDILLEDLCSKIKEQPKEKREALEDKYAEMKKKEGKDIIQRMLDKRKAMTKQERGKEKAKEKSERALGNFQDKWNEYSNGPVTHLYQFESLEKVMEDLYSRIKQLPKEKREALEDKYTKMKQKEGEDFHERHQRMLKHKSKREKGQEKTEERSEDALNRYLKAVRDYADSAPSMYQFEALEEALNILSELFDRPDLLNDIDNGLGSPVKKTFKRILAPKKEVKVKTKVACKENLEEAMKLMEELINEWDKTGYSNRVDKHLDNQLDNVPKKEGTKSPDENSLEYQNYMRDKVTADKASSEVWNQTRKKAEQNKANYNLNSKLMRAEAIMRAQLRKEGNK